MTLITNHENLDERLSAARLSLKVYKRRTNGFGLLYRGRVVFKNDTLRGVYAFLDGWIENYEITSKQKGEPK